MVDTPSTGLGNTPATNPAPTQEVRRLGHRVMPWTAPVLMNPDANGVGFTAASRRGSVATAAWFPVASNTRRAFGRRPSLVRRLATNCVVTVHQAPTQKVNPRKPPGRLRSGTSGSGARPSSKRQIIGLYQCSCAGRPEPTCLSPQICKMQGDFGNCMESAVFSQRRQWGLESFLPDSSSRKTICKAGEVDLETTRRCSRRYSRSSIQCPLPGS